MNRKPGSRIRCRFSAETVMVNCGCAHHLWTKCRLIHLLLLLYMLVEKVYLLCNRGSTQRNGVKRSQRFIYCRGHTELVQISISLIGGVHIGAWALPDMVWLNLLPCSGEEGGSFYLFKNDFYLTSRRQEGGGGVSTLWYPSSTAEPPPPPRKKVTIDYIASTYRLRDVF